MTVPFPQTTLVTTIAGESIPALAQRFGTPVYVYDAAPIVRRIGQLRAVRRHPLRPKGLLQSGDPRPDAPQRRAGRCGERGRNPPRAGRRLTSPASSPIRPIVYTADIFDREALDLVVKHDLHVNCGSPDMIDQYGAAAQPGRGRRSRCGINPGFGHGHSQKTNTGGEQSKHGIWHERLADCLAPRRRSTA